MSFDRARALAPVSAAAVAVVIAAASPACSRASDATTDAAAAIATSAPPASAAPPASIASSTTAPAEPELTGRFRRESEPYAGLVVELRRTASGLEGVVVEPPAVTPERIAAREKEARAPDRRRRAIAELECQATLWKAGERALRDVREQADGSFSGSAVVRDWGYGTTGPGSCAHADSVGKARIRFDGPEALTIDVARRGGAAPTTQRWSRVRP